MVRSVSSRRSGAPWAVVIRANMEGLLPSASGQGGCRVDYPAAVKAVTRSRSPLASARLPGRAGRLAASGEEEGCTEELVLALCNKLNIVTGLLTRARPPFTIDMTVSYVT